MNNSKDLKMSNVNEKKLFEKVPDSEISPENKKVLDLLGKMERKPAQVFYFSEQAVGSIMFILQNSIQNTLLGKSDEEVDISKMLQGLELIASTANNKVYVQNPPNVVVTPELEKKLKEKYVEKLKEKSLKN